MVDFCSTIRRIKIRIDSIDSSKDRTNIFKIKDIFHSIRTTLTRGRKYEFRMNRINIVSNRTRNVATGVVGGKAGISEQQFQSTCLHCLFVLQYWFYKYYFLLSWYILFRANGKHGAIFRTKCATVLDGRRGSH